MSRIHWTVACLLLLVIALPACRQKTAGPSASDYQRERAAILEKHKSGAGQAAQVFESALVLKRLMCQPQHLERHLERLSAVVDSGEDVAVDVDEVHWLPPPFSGSVISSRIFQTPVS